MILITSQKKNSKKTSQNKGKKPEIFTESANHCIRKNSKIHEIIKEVPNLRLIKLWKQKQTKKKWQKDY